jgi:hypothetical protein
MEKKKTNQEKIKDIRAWAEIDDKDIFVENDGQLMIHLLKNQAKIKKHPSREVVSCTITINPKLCQKADKIKALK